MIRIAIVDDEVNILEKIKSNVYREFNERNSAVTIVTYTNGKDLLNAVKTGYLFDVIFLDIELPDGLGLDVAKQLRDSYQNIIIVFVTSFDNYVYDAFDYDVIGYIRKQELNKRLSGVIDRIIKIFTKITNEYIFKNNNGQYRISTQDIVYFESDDHNITLHSNDGKEFSYTDSLKRLEEEFSVYGFFRIHAGYLVNLRYVYSIENGHVVLKYSNKSIQLAVSRGRCKELKSAYQKYFRGGS